MRQRYLYIHNLAYDLMYTYYFIFQKEMMYPLINSLSSKLHLKVGGIYDAIEVFEKLIDLIVQELRVQVT